MFLSQDFMSYIGKTCDDIQRTVRELKARGVEFTDAIKDAGYGLAMQFRVPGDFEVELYRRTTRRTEARPLN